MASIQEHFKHITKYGTARTNRFQVIIVLPIAIMENLNEEKGEKEESFLKPLIGNVGVDLVKAYMGSGPEVVRGLDIMCESAEIPGKSLSTDETRYNRDFIKQAYGITYNDTEFVFTLSRDFYEKNIIDMWMNYIVDPDTHEIEYYYNYVSPVIEIRQLNEQDEITHRVLLRDAFPYVVNAMKVDNGDRDSIHKLTVGFMYRKWDKAEIEQPSGVSSLSQTPLGPYVTPILSNPAVQRGLDFLEDRGLDLEGGAVDIYNQIDGIVKNTTGQSTNQTAGLLNGIRASVDLNGDITDLQKSKLFDIIDGTLSKLGS